MNRRTFLAAAGVMFVEFPSFGQVPGSPSMKALDSWVAIGADGTVTAYSGKEELGQGIFTAQAQLVAEELCVAFAKVNLITCDTALTPDQAHTSGSQSHPANFNHGNLALACATAREALIRLASAKLGVPVSELSAVNGEVRSASKKIGYGELVGGQKFNLTLDPNAKRRDPKTWTVLGKPIPRTDIPDIVTGRFEFVQNVRVPGMLHGRVVRPPSPGAKLASVDGTSISGMPGVVKIVTKKDFVGVVAEKPWQAIQAAQKLKVNWTPGPALPPFAGFADHLKKQQPTRDTRLLDSGDVDQKLASAATVMKGNYYHPYQMHGSVGGSCAVADVQGDKATIWSGTQGVWYQKSACATLLGLKPADVHVIFRRGSGCYGLNGADTVTYDAAVMSQAVGKPVRVQLSRADEMAWENFGHAYALEERVGLDAQGNIIAWDHESWSPTLGNRPGPSTPGNVVTGTLLGYAPEPFVPRSPAPAAGAFNNNSNGIPSYAGAGCGNVKSVRVLVHNVRSAFFTGPLRSPARLQNTFAHECFMDEIAARLKADPLEYRLRHLSFFRLRDALTEVAKAANWQKRPSPNPKRPKTGMAPGRGIAVVAYEGDNGYAALVAEIEVDLATGRIVTKRIVVSNDSGPISNPDGMKNQIEGGALQGLSRALGEEVTWDETKVTSVHWGNYRSLTLGMQTPVIESVLINRPEEEACGSGETSITLIQAAIGNAIFDATGARLREAPFTPARVLAAIKASS